MLGRLIQFAIHQRGLVIAATMGMAILGIFNFAAFRSTRFRTSPMCRYRSTPRSRASRRWKSKSASPSDRDRDGRNPGPRTDAIAFALRPLAGDGRFQDGTDIYFARQLVNERLQEARGIAAGIRGAELGPIATGLGEIFMWTVEARPAARSRTALRTRRWTCASSGLDR